MRPFFAQEPLLEPLPELQPGPRRGLAGCGGCAAGFAPASADPVRPVPPPPRFGSRSALFRSVLSQFLSQLLLGCVPHLSQP